MTITVDNPAFRAVLADIDRSVDRMDAARRQVGQQVDALLDGDWAGVAAQAFGEGWAAWWRGSQEVLDGLTALGRLVETVRRDLVQQDEVTQVRIGLIARDILASRGR